MALAAERAEMHIVTVRVLLIGARTPHKQNVTVSQKTITTRSGFETEADACSYINQRARPRLTDIDRQSDFKPRCLSSFGSNAAIWSYKTSAPFTADSETTTDRWDAHDFSRTATTVLRRFCRTASVSA